MNDSYRADPYREWDAAYLLGSLSPSDRHEYEEHLEECPDCSASIAELAVLPGLLSRVPANDVDVAVEQAPVPATLLPRLVAAVRRRHRIRTMVTSFAAAAAVIAVALVLVIPHLIPANPEQRVAEVTLSQVVASPLHADIRLVEHQWGTSIDMKCSYAASPNGYGGESTYAMYVTDAAGNSTQLATWTAKPGRTVEPSATTSLALAEIRSVDVRALDSGQVLLSGAP